MLIIYFLIFIVSFFVLAKSGGMLVKLTSKISAFLEVSEFLFSFVIIGIATSLPEIFISVSAALSDNSVLAFGNNIGSNILYPTLVLGATVLCCGNIMVDGYRKVIGRNIIYSFGIALFPIVFMWDFQLSRLEGLTLIILFIFYVFRLIKRRESFPREYDVLNEKKNIFSIKSFFKNFIYLVIGFVFLYAGAEGVVRSATKIAIELNTPLIVVSIFLVAFGAVLPEFIFSIQAARNGKSSIILGNIFGSLVTNSALALGGAAVINPVIILNVNFFHISALFAFLSLFVFGIFMRSGNVIRRKEGVIMIIIYVIFSALILFSI